MAEAVVQIVIDNLSSFIQKELSPLLSFDEDLRRLSSKLTAIKATLEDAEEHQFTKSAVKDWLQKLKDAAHMLDDILDECATEASELEDGGLNCGLPGKLQSPCLSSFHPKHVTFRRKIAKKMKMIRERLDEIAEERHKFHLNEIVTDRRTEDTDRGQTTSIITQSQVYGREKEKNNIADFLVGDASNFEDLTVYPILGVGGLGKTTLAQLIFNHERVEKHFEQRIWVCVSKDFSLKRMTKAIIESASRDACADMDLEPLQRRLREMLQRKRYLLVLDDVWDHNQDNWHRLKDVLACGAKGASILVTTRLLNVATVMGTMPPHKLSILSDNDCWELFKGRAFGLNEVERADLTVIGKEIVKKCAGVPLAAVALGSLLRLKREKREWISVNKSKLWNLEGENSVMPALRLSYLNLPVKLRQCFAFCALFPKNKVIRKQCLIEIWMANGFISSNEMMEAEDVCDEVWNELYWRSFFQDIETDEFGKITSFKMHDLVHDLAQSITQDACCIAHENGIASIPEGIRHLSIYRQESFEKVDSVQGHQVKSLKTCIIEHYVDQFPPHVLKHPLRALYCKGLNNLPPSIGCLKYLRYLNISYGRFRTLPESICTLRNLQTLNLERCMKLQMLPKNFKSLKALQHLCLRNCDSLSRLPPSIGELTSLRKLSMYLVGKERGFHLAELGRLKLKGDLHIKHLERVTSLTDAKEAKLGDKHLNDLLLSWDRNEESQLPNNAEPDNAEQILEVLEPNIHHLQTLGVGGYTGVQLPQWISSHSLIDLCYVFLVDCKSCLNLPSLGKLPSLKRLEISNMNHVKYLNNESYESGLAGGFVALEILILDKLPNLIRLSSEEGENTFPRLCKLQISECPELALPCLPSLKELKVRGKCSHDLLSSVHNFTSLESLCFSENEELTRFPNGMLKNATSLKTLQLHGLPRLEVIQTEIINLCPIEELWIWGCDSLESLPDQVLQRLHSLKILRILDNPKFKLSAGFQHLTCLEQLEISRCPEVEGLPKALQHMTALQILTLYCLPNLRSLPEGLGNLTLLKTLEIVECPHLTYLPMSIRSLRNLRSLKVLSCPELQKRCVKETGQDWPLIAHVQNIQHSEVDTLIFMMAMQFIRMPPRFIVNERGV